MPFSINPTTIAPEEDGTLPSETTITVTFNPSAEENYEATIRHRGAGLVADVILTLTGGGVLPAITLQTGTPAKSITELTFGSLRTAATPTTQEYTISGVNFGHKRPILLLD